MSAVAGSPANPARKRALLAIAAVVALAALAWAVYWWVSASRYQATDDAYVQGNVVQVTPQVAGTVVRVAAEDTDAVAAGQPLVELDPTDANLALASAEAALAQAVRQLGQVYGNDASSLADVRFREADLARTGAELASVEQDLARRRALAQRQVISREDLAHAQASAATARSAQRAAQAALEGARSQLGARRALTEGVDIAGHPDVVAAATRVRQALVDLQRTRLVAPVGGVVARRSVQLGQRVQAGAPLLAIVPLDQVWVDANFKEVQLRDLRVGQPATLVADQFGKKVVFHGRVAGFGAGTGAAFALLPAQNATGNWIKVVQRVPVRIALDPAELRAHPLRVGLSMSVEVDVQEGGGAGAEAGAAASASAARTPRPHDARLAAAGDARADAVVARIVAENLRRSPPPSVAGGAASRSAH
jgi:membrane fusion protein (multidrug efflux system)